MADALQTILQLEKQGLSDSEIIKKMQEQGFSPKEINDALNQSKVKSAVSAGEESAAPVAETEAGEMQPSVLEPEEGEEEIAVPTPTPKPSRLVKAKKAAPVLAPIAPEEELPYALPYAPATEVSEAEAYPYAAPQAAPAPDIETIEEIAEEIVAEKFDELKNKIGDIIEFKEDIQSKINFLGEKTKRIETVIDSLQAALLGKVQEYGQNIKDLGAEMRSMEGAFSKILNPLIDNIKELSKITAKLKGERAEVGKEEKTKASKR